MPVSVPIAGALNPLTTIIPRYSAFLFEAWRWSASRPDQIPEGITEDKMSTDFHRIRRLPPYVFAHIDPLKAKARAEGVDVIDLGMGNPDMPTPEHIVAKLQETVKDGRTHRYSTSRGIPGLRKAQASYYGRRFGVKLNPDTQVVATLGSKEGFANMASAITAPGDVVLVPNPTYPILHHVGRRCALHAR
jgi:aspartate/methionine/tyrosine aminotransferase